MAPSPQQYRPSLRSRLLPPLAMLVLEGQGKLSLSRIIRLVFLIHSLQIWFQMRWPLFESKGDRIISDTCTEWLRYIG